MSSSDWWERPMLRAWRNLTAAVVSASGFFMKEIVTVLLQPRLIAGLVLGPFLIMMVFGLGYRGPHPEFRTILVIPPAPKIAEKVDVSAVYREGLSGVFRLIEVTADLEPALARLRNDEADVVVAVPPDLYEQVYGGKQATLNVFYTETDPTSNAWVRYFTSVQTAELNRRLLVEILGRTREPAGDALEFTERLLAELDALEAELRSQDRQAASVRAERLGDETRAALREVGRELDTLNNATGETLVQRDQARRLLLAIEQDLRELQAELDRGAAETPALLARLEQIRRQVRQLHAIAARVHGLPIEVLVSPLTASAQNVAPVEPTPAAFYTPAVLALLLQHIGVTLASLSAVRDRLLGSLELFRVAPVGAADILIGKSLGYGVLLAIVGAALTGALIGLLEVPLLGDPAFFALAVGLIIFAAVGLGFALATLARTESQAVQLSLLVLLTSVFFGGFFLPTNLLFAWVRTISFALPVTYGAINLRDLMLRGAEPDWQMLAAPVLLGCVFYAIALLGLHRQMRRA
jgi:ABC-2 type transport system permease protein